MTPDFRTIRANGVNIRAAVQGAGPLVVMVHGFPESWYSWRHQMAPLAAAGFTACAIDVRGYGGSDKPHAVEAYAMKEIAADVAGVIDALSPDAPAVLIGHDWGAPIVWHTAVLHPKQVRAVAGLSVPYYGLPPVSIDLIIKAMYEDQGKFFYQRYFKDEGVAEAAFEADVRAGLRKLYFTGSGDSQGYWGAADKKHGDPLLDGLENPDRFPAWMSEADIDYFVGEFERSGFRGPLNRYRNHTRDWEYMNTVADRIVHQPSLFIVGERDLVLKMFGGSYEQAVERMKANSSDFRGAHLIPKIGHWTQQEAPEATTGLLIDWLATL
jgi:pimeloyl-ACP methyl ester carboxylesterase